MTRWRPALRMAWRDLRRHKLRAALTMFLVALPIVVGTAVALVHHNTRWDGERQARVTMGAADALVEVTRFPKTRVSFESGDYMNARPTRFTRTAAGKRTPVTRPRSAVSLASLLPDGSRVTPAPDHREVALSSGGSAQLLLLDASAPMSVGLVSVAAGRAPTAPFEVAVNRPMAEELGMLDSSGVLRADAGLDLADGSTVHVVGILEPDSYDGPENTARLLAAPDSILRGKHAPHTFLVDLPAMTSTQTHQLARDLATEGLAVMPRDVNFHPAAWHVPTSPPSPVDPGSLAIGALVILFGLVEVVLIVGSAFAVGARRQVHDLGLLASSGGSPADVRRVLLAQGMVLGVLGSCVGAATGIGLFLAGVPLYEQVAATTVWTRDIAWLLVVGLTLLGSCTGLVAALVPAWSIGRLTPLAALSGRFPVRPGEPAAHRPAFVLAGLGLVVLALGGVWTAHEFAPPAVEPTGVDELANQPSLLPVAFGALGLILLIAGAVWSAPYVVRRVAGLGRLLPLSGRFAFRDAARHRFRTAASAVALTTTVAGAVLAGFVMDSVAASVASRSRTPAHSVSIDMYNVRAGEHQQQAMFDTVERVVGPVTSHVAYEARRPGRTESSLVLPLGEGMFSNVMVVDQDTLRYLVGENPTAFETFRSGGAVTTDPHPVRGGRVTASVEPGGRKPEDHWTLPATVVAASKRTQVGDFSDTWISPATAAALGFRTQPISAVALVSRSVTNDDLARLSVYGINAWSNDAQTAQLKWIGLGVVGGAGLLTALVVGIAVALAAAEGRSDVATFAAVGAGPWRRRALGAMHGVFLGIVGALLGLGIAIPSGLSLTQVDGLPGVRVPWLTVAATLLVVPLLAALAGWLVTPTRLSLVRRGN